MLKNYLKIALRTLRRHPGYALLNISGLALGLACFALIMLYVTDEWRYDRHVPDAEDVYRVAVHIQAQEGLQETAQSPPALYYALPDQFPEIAEVARLKPPRQNWMVTYEDRTFAEDMFTFADKGVFDLFGIDLIQGDPATALEAPETVVLTASMVEKYFGDEDPIGKRITLDSQYDLTVTGIMPDFPRTSHMHPTFFASYTSLADPNRFYLFNMDQAQFPFSYLYVRLAPGTDVAALEAQMPAFIEDFVPQAVRQNFASLNLSFQPLTDIHLHSNLQNEIEPNGDAATVLIFLAIGLFTLLIACVNFMNLATARSASRGREVGMRKVFGAHRRHITKQFLGEAVVLALLALVLAVVLVVFALPSFTTLTAKPLGLADLFAPAFLLLLLGATVVAGLLAGSYPAFVMSSFEPIAMLRRKLSGGVGGHALLRKSLIVCQFAISMVLIVGTAVVYQQMDFVQNKKLGLDQEQVAVVELTDPTPSSRYKTYKQAILQHPDVLSVSASQSAPAGLIQNATIRPENAPENSSWQVNLYTVDYDFTETMGMNLLAGRDYSRDFGSDTLLKVLVNETAARMLGWNTPEAALGQTIRFVGGNQPSPPIEIIGVVADFHSQSVREQIAPTVIGWNFFHFFAFVRIQPGNFAGTIDYLEQTWNEMVPGYTFSYSFLDQDFNRLYQGEDVLGSLLTAFALLTIFIACLGLFGLASFTAQQRTKEIGVRKVLGASTGSLVYLLSKEFTWLVLIAFAIAAPTAWFAMNRWLDGFAYHTTISLWLFVLAGGLSLLIAWLTISYQSIKAALSDPVRALRYE